MSRYKAYAEYKDSGVEWLGLVPRHWGARQLKFLCTCNDEVLGESIHPEYEIEYIDIGSVSASEGISKTETMLFNGAPSRARRIVRDGDVIISTVRTYLEAIASIDNPPPNLIASTGFAVIRPNQHLHKKFAAYCLRTSGFIKEVIARSVGVSYPAINASDLIDIKTPLPQFNEQEKIANFLDHETAKIDTLIAKQQGLIKLLKEKRQAVISHAVTKGLNPNAPMRDSGVEWLGEVPAHWSVSSIGYHAQISTGATPDRTNSEYWNGNIPWIKTGEVRYDEIFETEEYITELAISNSSVKISPPGTLLMAMYGQGVTRGRVAILGVPATYNQACAAINASERFFNQYLRYYFMAAYHAIRDGGNETSQMNLNADIVGKFKVTIPNIEEQYQIVEFLDKSLKKLDILLEQALSAIDFIQERRTALISAAVTGKIDVRGWQEPRQPAIDSTKELAL